LKREIYLKKIACFYEKFTILNTVPNPKGTSEFLFRVPYSVIGLYFYYQNLGLNTRLSHFVINQSRGCNFCQGILDPVPDETFLHLFFDCPVTSSWHKKFMEKYITRLDNLTRDQKLQLFFFGLLPNGTRDNHFLAVAVILFQFCIWEEKLRKKKPSFHTIENLYLESLRTIVHCNKKIRDSAELLNIPLCRSAGVAYNQPIRLRIPAPAQPQRQQPP
jgi:hypothetical protein